MQLLDILVCNLANKPSFQKMVILAELQVKMSRSCRFLLFLTHKYQVTLSAFGIEQEILLEIA